MASPLFVLSGSPVVELAERLSLSALPQLGTVAGSRTMRTKRAVAPAVSSPMEAATSFEVQGLGEVFSENAGPLSCVKDRSVPVPHQSSTMTFSASRGPRLVTSSTYVRSPPAATGSGDTDTILAATSAGPLTVAVVVAVSLFGFGSMVAPGHHTRSSVRTPATVAVLVIV